MTSSQLTDTHPSNMTVVSNDPSLWPVIYLIRFLSYFLGSCFSRWIMSGMSRSKLNYFAVSAFAALLYDYGE
jgi:hypothetical protein